MTPRGSRTLRIESGEPHAGAQASAQEAQGGLEIASVKTTAIDVPEGAMTQSAPEIARTLLAKNRDRGAGSINRFFQFYINRSGHNLPDERRRTLKRAMTLVRRHG